MKYPFVRFKGRNCIYEGNVLTLRPVRPKRPFSPGFPDSPCWGEITFNQVSLLLCAASVKTIKIYCVTDLSFRLSGFHVLFNRDETPLVFLIYSILTNLHWLPLVQGIPSLQAVHGLPEDQVGRGDHPHQQRPVEGTKWIISTEMRRQYISYICYIYRESLRLCIAGRRATMK